MVKGHKGFSLVELVCTIAIFSIIVTGVGTAMVVSARSYQSGNVELDLQQQAQITSNLLTNLIIDSDNVVQASGGTLEVNKRESGVLVTYTISYDGSDKIYYTTSSDPAGGPRVLAEHVTGFTVSQDIGGNVDFRLEFNENGRNYKSDYHVTPRNGISSGGAVTSGTASIFVENRLILEPGQEYDLNVRVMGTSIQGFTIENLSGCTDLTGTTVQAQDTSTARIKVGLGETSSSFYFEVKALDGSIAPQLVTVLVRRVNAINVNGYKVNGSVNRAGASYKVTAPLSGTNLDREPGAWYDINYVNPYVVAWSFEFTKEGVLLNEMDYIEITGQGVDGNIPYITFKLKQDMIEGCKLRVFGTALHPEGTDPANVSNQTNKSGLKYGTVSGFWDLDYQAWKRNGKLDIAVHHLSDDNFWFEEDGDIMYKWNARVKFTAYDNEGNTLSALAGDFDPWQREQHLPIKADLDLNNVRDKWDLTLMPYHESNNVWDWGPSYSLPYILAYYNPPFDRNFYLYNANPYFINSKLGVAGYSIELYYEYLDENGVLVNETIHENYEVEEVSVLYRNALDAACSWQRDNKIFVTTADTITDYKVHFQFDRGWDEDDHDYHFIDLKRFVGVVADRPGYVNDVRRDIAVTGNEIKKVVPDGDSVLIFTLTAADKAECKALADEADGTITMIYEYDPFLGRLPRQQKTESELRAENPSWASDFWGNYNSAVNADPTNPRWYKEYDMPLNIQGVTLTQDMMDNIRGCAGKVIFCFKDPNITGATLKTMYCPTLTEYGPLYYIDDTSRFSIQATTAQYQELVGGTWSTVVNLTWNGSGWIAN